MGKKLSGKALAKFEAKRNVWQEVLVVTRDQAGRGKRAKVEAKSYVVQFHRRSQEPRLSGDSGQ